jgi:hypothetical protein
MKTSNTIRMLVLLTGCAGAMTAAEVVAAAAAKTGEGVSGIWWIEDYARELLPPDNADLPFTPEGRLRYEQNLAQLKAGAMPDVGVTKCLPEGLPRTMFAPYPLQIVQHGNYVTLIHEVNHTFWSVALTGGHPGPDDLEPAFMGDSIGHWDHGMLVIDSIGFKANSFLDDTGVPHGTQLHVTTRLRRLSHTRLEVIATVDDPDTFSKSFSVRHTYEWRPDVSLLEYACGEDHRVLTGTRTKGVTLKWPAK